MSTDSEDLKPEQGMYFIVSERARMKDRINKHKVQTGKRLGFKFYADNDVK